MSQRQQAFFTMGDEVVQLPIFFLEGQVMRPMGLEAEIRRIYQETADEIDGDDPIPPKDVLLLTPRSDKTFDPDDPASLPRVVIRFPYNPEPLFLDQTIRIRFSIRSFDARYNIVTLLPNHIELLDILDGLEQRVDVYAVSSRGYLLVESIDLNPGSDEEPAFDDELDSDADTLPSWPA
ncbi:hypothetical protein C8J56DRAFT_900217 [Mycena floridula]|nr:hypothetical protein C8J56DRAFT_900217 [Mycena floridula]